MVILKQLYWGGNQNIFFYIPRIGLKTEFEATDFKQAQISAHIFPLQHAVITMTIKQIRMLRAQCTRNNPVLMG
jgi:hypothetical protein